MAAQGDEHVLEVDGSVMANGESGCGGPILKHEGDWVAGFCCKLIQVPPTIAEIFGVSESACEIR